MNNEIIINKLPTEEEYCGLRKICGLSPRSEKSASIALKRSLFCVSIREKEKLIGMGRLIGDGGSFVQIVDIAIHPEFQKRGISRKIMETIMDYISKNIPEDCHVSLLSDVDYLYEKFGFVKDTRSFPMLLKR